MALLEIKNLHAFYGKSHVLHGVDLQVNDGEIVSLLGRNGAGRSTTLKAAMGQVDATGSIRFKGEEIGGLPVFEIARRGLGYVTENRDIFPSLTVEQNLSLGEMRGQQSRWSINDMYRMFPLLAARQHVPAGVLSGGEQQMLALCRTLMGNPDLIMIDEPTEGLAPKIVQLVASYLTELKNRGVPVLLVEQKQAIALEISQRVYVMGHGAIVFEGTPDELRADAGIRNEWLAL
jgi:branched-chain amino acid transport system ATP-binding protein